MGDDLSHFFRCKHRSLQDKQKVILAGPIGRGNSLLGKPKPLKALKKKELLEELGERGLLKEVKSDKKVDLESELMSQLRGVQRVPALLYSSPATPLEDLGLASYEALPCEPMHDLSNHISNLLEELPKHLTGEQKRKLEETWELTLAGKETKRASDYRSAIILFSRRMRGFLPETRQTLLDTFVEMEEVLYSKDYKRCPRLILRYHSNFAICHLEFGSTPSAQSAIKLYGKYLHNLVSHEPIQLRLISGQSSNAENEERIFNAIKGITTQHPATNQAMSSPMCSWDSRLKKNSAHFNMHKQHSRNNRVESLTWPQLFQSLGTPRYPPGFYKKQSIANGGKFIWRESVISFCQERASGGSMMS